ncbi:hypothetical protein [Spirosoma validum]|uniref:Uncharacterized protein n=1 Tax=Spirosoma validum TaxID=2771355 RepID=A0A927GBQ6_9BACT|nr:hypothetical protein [Spirosoma validum]MBD2751854.1 hypothetical protein [Spirosoma validum]
MPVPDKLKQTWFIEQFLLGNLPTSIHKQIEERLSTEPEFKQRVMAQWLVLNYFTDQQQIRDFYQEIDPVIINAGKRKPRYDSHKGIRYLPQLIGIAAVLLLSLGLGFLVYRYNQPLHRQVSTVPVLTDDPEDYGFSSDEHSVVVIRYDRLPDVWDFGNKYIWKADTLAIYSPSLAQSLTKNWQIIPTSQRNVYVLMTEKQTYQLLKGQQTLTPLQQNENR